MSVLTIVGSPQKGQDITIQLSKADLKAVSKVAADGYFSDESSWFKVFVDYVSTYDSQQLFRFSFDASEPVPEDTKNLDARFKGNFEFKQMKIASFNGSEITIYRSDINPLEYDINANLKTAPTPSITSVSNQSEFQVSDVTDLAEGYRVRLYNTNTSQYEADGAREISSIVSTTIVVDSAFVTTINPTIHELHFAERDDCNVEQQGLFDLP